MMWRWKVTIRSRQQLKTSQVSSFAGFIVFRCQEIFLGGERSSLKGFQGFCLDEGDGSFIAGTWQN